ncbi:MAG: hypothetical protein Q4C74_04885 [Rothia sp. (in: high G+C Gram-positive bacteria)]|nr:hypothetical protein [Rothia sp. (in: high G+C Gram-positive bacteria)]
MSEHQHAVLKSSRRGLMRFAALSGVVGLGAMSLGESAASENESVFPAAFDYPEIKGPSLALWGSSSIEGARATEGVSAGFDARLHTLLHQYLGVPVLAFGTGSETSSNILARRGVADFITKVDFPGEMIPASGSVNVTLSNSKISWNAATYFPGFIQEIPGVLKAISGAENTYSFTRVSEGSERYAPSNTSANLFFSYQEMISRSSYHLIQIGRNNILETQTTKDHTVAAFDMAAERTIVLGHYVIDGDSQGSERARAVAAYNDWGAQTYGQLFMNPQEYLRETTKETWLRYGDLAGSGVWNSNADQQDYEAGRPPRSLYAVDGVHLNGWGYLALARMIEAKIKELGWFS